MVNFVTIIQPKDVYENVGHACCNAGKCNFETNMAKTFSLTATSFNMICGNGNDNNIDKSFSTVCRAVIFVPKYGN